ncbi:MAG: TA system VapC family ribonuclease toxin [Bryobacter sp.]|nr:TA system VapC family ribonuclease toxin [Bryobacter sp.]
MKPCLADVNIWFSLLYPGDPKHPLAKAWFTAQAEKSVGLCRFVQIALIRLLSTRKLMGANVLSTPAAYNLIGPYAADSRVIWLPEPDGLDHPFSDFLHYPVPTPQLVADAYLAAFAFASRSRFVTFDKGFKQFRGLDLELLKH